MRSAFSIIELIVVVVILGVLAAAVAPRLISMSGRQAQADAQAVAELLSIAARRDELTSQRVAIDFDRERGSIRLLTRRNDGATADWRQDSLVPDAELRGSGIESAQSDEVELESARWRIEFPQVSRRPAVSLVIADGRNRESWRITLPAGASRAVVAPASSTRAADGSIDLDAAGKAEAAW